MNNTILILVEIKITKLKMVYFLNRYHEVRIFTIALTIHLFYYVFTPKIFVQRCLNYQIILKKSNALFYFLNILIQIIVFLLQNNT